MDSLQLIIAGVGAVLGFLGYMKFQSYRNNKLSTELLKEKAKNETQVLDKEINDLKQKDQEYDKEREDLRRRLDSDK